MNQHLSSVRAIFAELERQKSAPETLRCALEHGALQLLNSAYLCQLRAIADSYRCGNIAAISDAPALQEALAIIDRPAPEAAEIDVLISEGWLGALLEAHRQLCLPALCQVVKPLASVASQSDVALWNDDPKEPGVNVEKLQDWLLALEELVQRQSDMMVEY